MQQQAWEGGASTLSAHAAHFSLPDPSSARPAPTATAAAAAAEVPPHLLQDAHKLVVLLVLRGELKDLADAVVGLEVCAADDDLVGVVQELAGKCLQEGGGQAGVVVGGGV